MSLNILNLEWPGSDRDLNMTIPILTYLKKKYKLRCKTKSIFNGYYYLLKYRPKLLLISNFQGAEINDEVVFYANKMGIKVVSLISEGNVVEENLEGFLWGHNTRRVLDVVKLLVWSDRSKNLFLKKNLELEELICAVGAVGFDRYKLFQFIPKERFLQENKLEKYKKVIGIAAWGFDLLFGDYFKKHEKHYLKFLNEKQIIMHREDSIRLNSIYRELIEKNPDVLFILRYHPGNIDFTKSEFYKLDNYENTFVSNKLQNNYRIADLINISDLWIGYETTTALEAWLLNKTTFLINPSKIDFIREMTYKGSPIVKNAIEAQKYIDEFFSSNKIVDFDNLEDRRKEVIKDVIGYDDGKNYIRAAEEIMVVLNEPEKKVKFILKIYKGALKQLLKLFLSKTIFKNRWPHLKYSSDFAKPYQDMYDKAIHV